ncbi:MAG: hypothetical protein JXR53_14855 [Bacteroidales bacterium]|nr:hypothetical protein [Bacteroidales bacterium]
MDYARTIKGESNNYLFLDFAVNSSLINTCLYDWNIDSVITWIYYSSPAYNVLSSLGADFISEDTVLFCGSISNYSNMDKYAHLLKIDTASNVVGSKFTNLMVIMYQDFGQ